MRRPRLATWASGVAALAAGLLAISVGAAPASAITHGDLDGGGHPYVGLMVAKDVDGNPMWRCSGTLISPKVYLTAGHCTQAPAASVDIWFGSDLRDAGAIDFPANGDVKGTPYVPPGYDPADYQTHDVGVVVLDDPVPMPMYGELPEADVLDALATMRGQHPTTFTTVGYGVQRMFPEAARPEVESQRVRMVAKPRLIQLNTGFTGDYLMLVSANANTGGQCNGDSGGPHFLGDSNVVVGVTSFGKNELCRGTGAAFRIDRSWVLSWVKGFLPAE